MFNDCKLTEDFDSSRCTRRNTETRRTKQEETRRPERRLNGSKRRLNLVVAVAVAMVASLTRFLFSHPICLVDMPAAFSLTGKFTMPASPPAVPCSTMLTSSTGEAAQERKTGSREPASPSGSNKWAHARANSDYQLGLRERFVQPLRITSRWALSKIARQVDAIDSAILWRDG